MPVSQNSNKRIAVFSDIHGNLEAFREVLPLIRAENPVRIISLGDNVGYGPDPEPVMEMLREHRIESVIGNHEMAMKDEPFISWFNPTAQEALHFTRTHLSPESITQIKLFPKSLVMDDMRFVHGAPPSSPVLYLFQFTDEKLIKRFELLEERIFFVGHTHELMLIEYDGKRVTRNALKEGAILLDKKKKYMINVGSVGQPRGKDKRANFVVYDADTGFLTVKFIEYQRELTADKIVKAGIPELYAQKLL